MAPAVSGAASQWADTTSIDSGVGRFDAHVASSPVHRLAVNVILQDGRARGRRESREQLVADPSEYLGRVHKEMPGTRVDLERAIAPPPEGARAVLVLSDIQGYKYNEIAQMQGVALGTVKAQIHRARKMMREKLER